MSEVPELQRRTPQTAIANIRSFEQASGMRFSAAFHSVIVMTDEEILDLAPRIKPADGLLKEMGLEKSQRSQLIARFRRRLISYPDQIPKLRQAWHIYYQKLNIRITVEEVQDILRSGRV